MTDRCICLDNAATTRMMDTVYGNPSSLHSAGQRASEALQDYDERSGIIYSHIKMAA